MKKKLITIGVKLKPRIKNVKPILVKTKRI